MKRDRIDFNYPLHINQKLAPGLVNLRTEEFKNRLVGAIKAAQKYGLHVVQFSILKNHIHLVCEAKNNHDLGSGMRSLFGRVSRIIRRMMNDGVKGSVFRGRYFAKVIRSPQHMRRALEYVLFNKAKHQKVIEHIDTFSSAFAFTDWKTLLGKRYRGLIEEQLEGRIPDTLDKWGLSPPRSWLASKGWMKVAAALT